MKNQLDFKIILFALTFIIALNVKAQSEKMDLNDHNAVIEKLELILPNLTDDAKKQNTIQLRLADLYAERARLFEIKAGETNCLNCKEANQDRTKAIALYEKALPKASLENQKKSFLQLAHLYSVTGQTNRSEATLKRILSNKSLKALHSKAHLGLGDIQFSKQQFEKSIQSLNQAEKGAASEDKAYISFRKAWSELNLGNNQKSLQLIQKAVGQAQANNQTSLQKDLMRDYATILARTSFGSQEVNRFATLSLEEDRAQNLKFLGEEADRLGNKKGALLIWTQYAQQSEEATDSAELNFKMALNYYDLGQTQKSLSYLKKAVDFAADGNCEDKKCETLKTQFKSFLVNWNKKEKTEPSQNLLSAYNIYFELQPQDFEALIWAAQISQQRNDSKQAYSFYDRAAQVAYEQKNKKETERLASIAIEVAETTRDSQLKEKALKRYLELSPDGQQKHLVLYQLAYMAYQRKEYDQAAYDFKKLALDKSWKDTNTKIKAADLHLDILATQKKDRELRVNAITFAKEFKQKLAHFTEISRKVTNNILVQLVAQPDSSRSEIRSEIDILQSYSLAHLSNKEKIAQFRNIALAAEKISDINTVETISQKIMKTPGATAADIEFANKSLLWVAELKLEFKTAYKIASRMQMADRSSAEKQLKLGLLAELAGLNPEPHFNQYIRANRGGRKANELRVKMIRRSSNKWARLQEMRGHLQSTPDLLAAMTLELHLAKKNDSKVSQILKSRAVRQTPEGQYLLKLQNREKVISSLGSLRGGRIDSKNDRALQRSMKKKIAQLNQIKSLYQQAVRSNDIPLQARLLSAIEAENRRFYSQIQRLPTPRGLRPQERATYRQLINQQSQPFLVTADEAKANLEKVVTDNDKAISELEKALTSSDTLQRRLASNELNALKPYLSRSQVARLNRAMSDQNVSTKKIARVRQEIRINPLNTSVLSELRELEARRANGPLIAYLDQRIAQLKTTGRR